MSFSKVFSPAFRHAGQGTGCALSLLRRENTFFQTSHTMQRGIGEYATSLVGGRHGICV